MLNEFLSIRVPPPDLHAATPEHTELDSTYIAQAVLVEEEEEDEEEEEEEEDEVRKGEDEPVAEPRPPPTAPAYPPIAVQREELTAQESETEPEAAVEEGTVMEEEEPENDSPHCALPPLQDPSMVVHSEEKPELQVAGTASSSCSLISFQCNCNVF